LVAAPLFDFLLPLEEARALRLQPCFSLLRLRLDGPPTRSAVDGRRVAQQWAALVAGLLRNTDIVALLPEGSLGVLLIDADADVVPTIVQRIGDALEAWMDSQAWQSGAPVTWSAGAACFPRHAGSGSVLLHQTEGLMLRAAAEGGNRVGLPDEEQPPQA